jgi:serine/threonine protein phosphatase 1
MPSHDHIGAMLKNPQPSKFKPHLLLPENKTGRDFIVSDLHGHRSKLDEQLKKLNFSYQHDRLISVGDLIDRGPDSSGCLDLLEEPWFWTVRGNHEQMLIETIREQSDSLWSRWLMNGGSWVLDELDVSLNAWADTLKFLPITITLPCQDYTVGICHAEYNGEHWADRYEATDETIMEWLWGRTRIKAKNKRPVQGVDWIFSGHTIVPETTTLGNSVFIECGAYLDNPLTIIDLQQWVVDR